MKLESSGAHGVPDRCFVGAGLEMRAPCGHQGAPTKHQWYGVDNIVGTTGAPDEHRMSTIGAPLKHHGKGRPSVR